MCMCVRVCMFVSVDLSTYWNLETAPSQYWEWTRMVLPGNVNRHYAIAPESPAESPDGDSGRRARLPHENKTSFY